MDVGSEADVVSQVPPDVIGIFVDLDRVVGPIPVVAIVIVEGSHAEIETAEPEAFAIAAADAPNAAAAKAAGEAAVLPGVLKMEAGVIAALIAADPSTIGMDVRSVGMAFTVVETAVLLGRMLRGGTNRRRAVARNELMRLLMFLTVLSILRKGGNGTEQEQSKDPERPRVVISCEPPKVEWCCHAAGAGKVASNASRPIVLTRRKPGCDSEVAGARSESSKTSIHG